MRQEREQKERALEESEEEKKRAQVLFEAREQAHQEEKRALLQSFSQACC